MFVENKKLYRKYERNYNCIPSFLPEFFAVKHGLKPMSAHIVPADVPQLYDQLRLLCEKNNLFIGHSKFKLCYDRILNKHRNLTLDTQLRGGDIFVYISYSRNIIDEAIGEGSDFQKKAQAYLGYPDCCIRNYERIGADQNLRFTSPLKKSKNHSFYLNNFLHWEGPYYLISHFPCSYRCKKSIAYAKKLLEIIEIEDPVLFKEIKYMLTRPVLYNGYKSHVRFNGGFVTKGVFRYDRVYGQTYKSLNECFFEKQEILQMHNGIVMIVGQGNKLVFQENYMKVFSDDIIIGSINRSPNTFLIEWQK